MRETKIICAFPATGKTWLCKNQAALGISVLDLDSSYFRWKYSDQSISQIENPEFPRNYIDCIKANLSKYDYILVSTHSEVRQALRNANLEFILIYPLMDLKEEWIGRCYLRNDPPEFLHMLADNWQSWIRELDMETKSMNSENWHVLSHGMYLLDALYIKDGVGQ